MSIACTISSTARPTPTVAPTATHMPRVATDLPIPVVQLTGPKPTPTQWWCQVHDASVLNVRRGPSLQDEIIGGIVDGIVVTVTGKYNGWLRIKTAAGFEGYVYSEYCKE